MRKRERVEKAWDFFVLSTVMPELPCVYCHAPSVIAAVSPVPEKHWKSVPANKKENSKFTNSRNHNPIITLVISELLPAASLLSIHY
jgi:hypothetical protein